VAEYLDLGLKAGQMFIPDLLDMVPNCRSMRDIRVLEIFPERHENLAQMRTFNDV